MIIIPAILIGLCVGGLTYWIFSLRLPHAGDLDSRRRSLPSHLKILLTYAQSTGRVVLSGITPLSPGLAQSLEGMADRLALEADRPGEIRGKEVVGLCVLVPLVVGAFLALYCACLIPRLLGPALLVGIPAAAALPVLYLRGRRATRLRRIRNAFPTALDLLTLCIEAGMDFTEGMKVLANRCAGRTPAAARKRPDYFVCKLFTELLRDIQMGVPRAEALHRMERKAALPEVGSFATTLSLADQSGGSVAENLQRLASEMRQTRVMRAEEHIAKAPVKMIFPIALFLFPVVFLIILGPIGITLMDSLRF